MKEFNIYGLNYPISAMESVPEHAREIILACHGFCGDKYSSVIEKLCEKANGRGCGLICFDFPGHGMSPVYGDCFTIENCIHDLYAVHRYALEKYPESKIYLYGMSFGGFISLLYLSTFETDIKKAFLRSPALDLKERFKELVADQMENLQTKGYIIKGYERLIKVTKQFFEETQKIDLYSMTDKIHTKLTIIHGDADTSVPVEDSIRYAQISGCILKIVPGADHRYKKDGELDIVIDTALKAYGMDGE